MKSKRGYTLVETLIAVLILFFVIVIVARYVLTVTASRSKVYATQEVQINSRAILHKLSKYIHEADSVHPASIFDSDAGLLILNMPNPAQSPTIFGVASGVFILWDPNGFFWVTDADVFVSKFRLTDLTPTGGSPNIGIEFDVNFKNEDSAEYGAMVAIKTAESFRK